MKIPFLKMKLKSGTIYSIFALLMFLAFLLTIFSFYQKATFLNSLNELLVFYFGKGAIFTPVMFLFAAGVMIQTKKMRIVKPHWFLGYMIMFVSYLIILNAGYFGSTFSSQISDFISRPGTIVSFVIIFLIGALVMFEMSIIDGIKVVANFVASLSGQMEKMQGTLSKGKEKNELLSRGNKDDFVGGGNKKEHDHMLIPKSNVTLSKDTPIKGTIDGSFKPIEHKSTGVAWKFPPLSLLDASKGTDADRGDVKHNSDMIEETLDSFGIKARVADVNYGPAITQYAIQIAKGVNLSKVTALSNNLALALAAPNGQIRIEAPIPGKSLIGIEVPNIRSQVVTLRQMLSDPIFGDRSKLLLVPMGVDVSGQQVALEINKMPHVLVAGTTGSGKSVMLSSWICTLMFRTTPDEVGLVLIDPKRVTFMMFDETPHLITPVITDLTQTVSALKWAVKEMEDRYKTLADARSRDIFSYNEAAERDKRMRLIIICIDELADLMMYASKEVEDSITRIAQKARAVGIYLVVATQRPSVDVITGLMKANIPARIAFNVSSMIDSRVIIDMPGAEKLLGRGDMLFLSPEQSKPRRIQGPFVTDKELKSMVEFLKTTTPVVHYTEEVTQQSVKQVMDSKGNVSIKSTNHDALFADVVRFVCQTKKASSSLLQRKFSIGYSRAARIVDELEQAGVVGPADGPKARDILVSDPEEFLKSLS
jgi:S-DNA-T family DNA segregation ATPase FtsK/SpoIIIE